MVIGLTFPALMLAALTAAVSLLAFDGLAALLSCLLGWSMLAIAVSDSQRLIVPDLISLPAIPAGVAATAVLHADTNAHALVLEHVAAALAAGAAFYLIGALYRLHRGHDGLGLGDVKLAAVAGAWTGWEGVTMVVLLACLSALCFVFTRAGADGGGGVTRATLIPFGAFLAPSIWLVWALIQLRLLPVVM